MEKKTAVTGDASHSRFAGRGRLLPLPYVSFTPSPTLVPAPGGFLSLFFLLGALLLALTLRAADGRGKPSYSHDVVPILKKYCAGCHNAEEEDGGLVMDSFATLMKGGENGVVVHPGDSGKSRLILVLTGQAKPQMPPKKRRAPSPAEIEVLRRWVDVGAPAPDVSAGNVPALTTPRIEPVGELNQAITALAYSPTGQLLARARFRHVDLLMVDQLKSGKLQRRLSSAPGKVHALSFSSEGDRVLAASGVNGLYGRAILWNTESGKVVREFTGHRDTLYAAEMDPSGGILATGSYDRRIILWNVSTGEQLRTISGHNGAVYDLAFSPDGRVLASASGDETVKLWRVTTGERLDTLHQPLAEQYVVRFSPNGQFVIAGGADNRIRVWRFVSREHSRINPMVYARFAHEGALVDLAFSRGGKQLVSAAENAELKVWNVEDFSERHAYEAQSDVPAALAVSPVDETFVVGRLDGSLEKYGLPAGRADVTTSGRVAKRSVSGEKSDPGKRIAEQEPNDTIAGATLLPVPGVASGTVHATGGAPTQGTRTDVDLFRFQLRAADQWVIEVNAARKKSPLDSMIAILDAQGQPVRRALLQAVRDSYFTFRGQNSDTSDGFRLHNWEEMELNEYLYAGGEVVKLWHYPRGPDSGFILYPGTGKRYTYFGTTALSHPVHEPCYIVRAYPPGAKLIPNGLPVFPIDYENDDDGRRRFGADSRLTFTVPSDGAYFVRVTDVRGFHGPDFNYELRVRPRRPDFKVSLSGSNPTVNAGSGKEFKVNIERLDGFEGEVHVDITGVPPGFTVTSPLRIEARQNFAIGTLNASLDAPQPNPQNAKATKVVARAMVNGREVTREVNNLGEIKLAGKPKLRVSIDGGELTIAPGETISARVRVERNGFNGRVSFGHHDSGRNLPHGVYVDNIGLNGLMVVEGQTERTFYITAAKWVQPQSRQFFLRATDDGQQTSLPVTIRVQAALSGR